MLLARGYPWETVGSMRWGWSLAGEGSNRLCCRRCVGDGRILSGEGDPTTLQPCWGFHAEFPQHGVSWAPVPSTLKCVLGSKKMIIFCWLLPAGDLIWIRSASAALGAAACAPELVMRVKGEGLWGQGSHGEAWCKACASVWLHQYRGHLYHSHHQSVRNAVLTVVLPESLLSSVLSDISEGLYCQGRFFSFLISHLIPGRKIQYVV